MASLLRVENPNTGEGLWYNTWGDFTEYVKTLADGQCRDLPMPYNEDIAGGWYSACDNFKDMSNWFSPEDLLQLEARGYGLYHVLVPDTDVREVDGHVVFRRENATLHQLPMRLLNPSAFDRLEQAFMGFLAALRKMPDAIEASMSAFMSSLKPRKQLIHNGKKP